MTRRKTILLIGLVLFAAFIGYAVNLYRGFSHRMQAEYGAASTIQRVTEYVETHEGRWPSNWDEIEPWPGVRDVVVVQFDVDIERLIADPEAIQTTIVPITGRYGTYPHARAQLEQLRKKLIELHKPKGSPGA